MRTFRWGSGARWRAILLALMVPLVATGAIFISQDPRPLLVTIAATLLVGQVFIRRERRGTAAREKERSTLDAVMHGATEGILVVDCDGRVGFVDPMFRRLFDLPSASVVGRPFAEVLDCTANRGLIGPDARALLENAMSASDMIVFEPLPLECTPQVELEVTSYPLHNGQGESLGRTVILRDVTKANDVQRMKSQFLATASHQLRTPMTSILAFSELLTSRGVSLDVQSGADTGLGELPAVADAGARLSVLGRRRRWPYRERLDDRHRDPASVLATRL